MQKRMKKYTHSSDSVNGSYYDNENDSYWYEHHGIGSNVDRLCIGC